MTIATICLRRRNCRSNARTVESRQPGQPISRSGQNISADKQAARKKRRSGTEPFLRFAASGLGHHWLSFPLGLFLFLPPFDLVGLVLDRHLGTGDGQLQPCAGHLFFLCLGTDTLAIVIGQYALELHGDLIRPVLEDTQGKSYRGNIEGSDPRCSFHWVGTSDRLYVFEAPIDLLAFLTLYPDGWQQHSYVALCGTAEHAMLWMLEKNPNLRKAILCLDHDAAGIEAAGIEAAGRLSDILREHGYSQIASLQSEHKDWDEDLKAWNGLEAQPAEEHPQFAVAGLVCRRIGARCKEVQPDRAVYQFPGLLLRYRNDLHWGRFDQAMERMETMAALALSVVLRECKQMGTALTTEQGVRFLESHILPHQNRGSFA